MSDTSQGPGWWQASDGKWYRPESHPDYVPPAPPPPPPPPLVASTPIPSVVTPEASGRKKKPAKAAAKRPAKKLNRKGWGCLTSIIIFILIVVIIVVAGGSAGTSYKASFQAGGITAVNPAEAKVYITVVNTGKNSGTPTCTINLSSPGGAYTGFDGLTPVEAIPAGKQESYTDTITVTNQGAKYVTVGASTVTCS